MSVTQADRWVDDMTDKQVDRCMDNRQTASRQKQLAHKVCSQIDRNTDLIQEANGTESVHRVKEPCSQILGNTRNGSGSYLLLRCLEGAPAHDTKACGLSCLTLPQANLHCNTPEFDVGQCVTRNQPSLRSRTVYAQGL